LQEAPLPGWGNNVPNLVEWEALDKMSEAHGDISSRILPLKDLENQETPTSETNSISKTQGDEEFQPSKRDACIPWEDDENNEGWLPAVSRTTHRKYLRRKARRDALKGSEQSFDTSSIAASVDDDNDLSENCSDPVDGSSVVPEKTISNTDSLEPQGENGVGSADTVEGRDATDACSEQLDNLDIKSETEEGLQASFVDDESSEQSWALRSLSESTVACVTSDYAMQNVILQIGLRLLAPGGMQIRQLHRYLNLTFSNFFGYSTIICIVFYL
jgi:RNA-binding protein NOB1